MSSEYELIEDGRDLKPGDVVRVDVTLMDRETGRDRLWQRFACVVKRGRFGLKVVNLKLDPQPKDFRLIALNGGVAVVARERQREKVYKIPADKWPQGVVAMRMKLIMTKVVTLGDDLT
jgi:hypothetical protein